MRIIVTGATGFLGWHTRVRLRALTDHEVVPVTRSNWSELPSLMKSADAVLHLAGINRAPEARLREDNARLAENVADAIRASGGRPAIVYSNSIQQYDDNAYGSGKRDAAEVLRRVAKTIGSNFSDVVLPNLFGEHGAPQYNSFVATFVHDIVANRVPRIDDRPVELLHVQRAAAVLIGALESREDEVRPSGKETSVRAVFDTLRTQYAAYRRGDFPALTSNFGLDLFNTLRVRMLHQHGPIRLHRRADDRGALTETVRVLGGEGQSFVSTTRPGVTRGQHFHLRKVERFVVIAGEARISLRRVLTDDVVHFKVTGDHPVAIDMPTLWAHKITNVGNTDLTTMFWTSELFDPADPDTHPEEV